MNILQVDFSESFRNEVIFKPKFGHTFEISEFVVIEAVCIASYQEN